MVESYAGINLKNYVRSLVYQGKRLLHIHLNKMEFHKG
jgi:hypothetical protein